MCIQMRAFVHVYKMHIRASLGRSLMLGGKVCRSLQHVHCSDWRCFWSEMVKVLEGLTLVHLFHTTGAPSGGRWPSLLTNRGEIGGRERGEDKSSWTICFQYLCLQMIVYRRLKAFPLEVPPLTGSEALVQRDPDGNQLPTRGAGPVIITLLWK